MNHERDAGAKRTGQEPAERAMTSGRDAGAKQKELERTEGEGPGSQKRDRGKANGARASRGWGLMRAMSATP